MANVTSRQNAEHYFRGEGCEGWHLLKAPGLSVIQERVPTGKHQVRHYHRKSPQFFFVAVQADHAGSRWQGAQAAAAPGLLRTAEGAPSAQRRRSGRAGVSCDFRPMSHGDRVEAEKE